MPRRFKRNRPTKEQIEKGKKKDIENCARGNHGINYQPVFYNGYEWDGKSVYCRNCEFRATIDEIDDEFWVKFIKDNAKYHKEAMNKLPLRKQFNKDGY